MSKRKLYYIAVFLVAMFITITSQGFGLLDRIENITYDWRVQALSKTKPVNDDIAMVVIDQLSLDWMEEEQGIGWPWPREVYGAITEFAREGGAKAVVFDMLFSEDSIYGRADDMSFADALGRLPSVGAIALSDSNIGTTSWPNDIARVFSQSCKPISESKSALFPTADLSGAFASIGAANAEPDSDGVIRRVKLCHKFAGVVVPSLPLALHKLFKPEDVFDKDEVIINYKNSPFSYDVYNAASIIQSWTAMQEGVPLTVKPDSFKDKVVFIGVSAAGLFDQRVSPLSQNHPGVDIQATILDNLTQDKFIKPLPFSAQVFYLIIFGAITTWLMMHSKNWWSFFIPLFILPFFIFAFGYLYYFYDYWLNITNILTMVYLIIVFSGVLGYLLEGRQKRYIQKAFSHYISPAIVSQLVENPERLKLGGESRELTIFFSDIWGFTSVSEQLEPEKLIKMLHEYLEALSSIIMDHKGTIDKYEGDAIIAFWNAPLEIEGHESLAVQAALACQRKLAELNPDFKKRYGVKLRTRIGLHTGKVIVGNLGSEKHFDYSFIGDAGNLAARLEGVNKVFWSDILVSKVTREKVEGISFRKIGTIRVVGRAEAVEVYQPLFKESDIKHIELFEKALGYFEDSDLQKAKNEFKSLCEVDDVSKKYLDIIKNIEDGTLKWDGAIVLQNK